MKVRNILIGLVVVLMAFVFISCDEEPEEQVQPTPTQEVVYTLSAKKGVSEGYFDNDKPRLVFTDKINEGDTLSLQFRSERDVYQFDIRNGSGKWVYQQDSSALTSYEEGEDGWITVTYTFGASYYDSKSVSYPQDGFDIRFRGRYFAGDLFEVKNVKINGELIPLKTEEEEGFTLTGFELAAADAVFGAKSYAVVYSVARPGDDDKTPLMEKVASGAKPAAANLEKTGYELELFTQYDEKGAGYVEDSKITLAQLRDLAIEKDTIIYLRYTGIPRTVTFMNGEVQFDQKQALHGTAVAKPETDPEAAAGYQFAAWCSDSGLTTPFDFTSAITADTTLYAKFNKVWTVSFNLNGKEATAIPSQTIIDGEKATAPAKPKTSGFRFKNWKLGEEIYDFTTSTVTEDIELVAEWEVAPTVNFTYVKNDGSDDETVVPTFIGEAAISTKPVTDPSRLGYTFLGWFDAATDGTEYPFTAIVEEGDDGTILYAHWTKNIKQIAFSGTYGYAGDKDNDDRFQVYSKGVLHVGDTLTIKFRSTRLFEYGVSLRAYDTGLKNLYYDDDDALGLYDDPDDDGWRTFTYTVVSQYADDSDHKVFAQDDFNAGFYICFHGFTLNSDILEINYMAINGNEIEIDKIKHGTFTAVNDHDWTAPETYVAAFFLDSSTKQSTTQIVAAGGKIVEPDPPAAPVGKVFAGWNKDKGGTDPARDWDFENGTLSESRKLYARFVDAE